MTGPTRLESQWVVEGDTAQQTLIEQGYRVLHHQMIRRVRWAYMIKDNPPLTIEKENSMAKYRIKLVPKVSPNANGIWVAVELEDRIVDNSWQRAEAIFAPHVPRGFFMVAYEFAKRFSEAELKARAQAQMFML